MVGARGLKVVKILDSMQDDLGVGMKGLDVGGYESTILSRSMRRCIVTLQQDHYILNDFTVFQHARSEEQDEGDEYIPYVPVKQRKQQMVSDFHSSICL